MIHDDFISKKMLEAHNAFIEHVSNRQDYNRIMLMRNVNSESSDASTDARLIQPYKRHDNDSSTAKFLLSEDITAKLIWDKWVAKNSPVSNHYKATLNKMLDRIVKDLNIGSWKLLGEWWMAYKGNLDYPEGRKAGPEKTLRCTLLCWYVDSLMNRRETPKTGSELKQFWCFLDTVVNVLRQLPLDNDQHLGSIAKECDATAILKFKELTEGYPHTKKRMDLIRDRDVATFLMEFIDSGHIPITLVTQEKAVLLRNNIQTVVNTVSPLLLKENPRASIDELNAKEFELDQQVVEMRDIWLQARTSRTMDIQALTEILDDELTYGQNLLQWSVTRADPYYSDAVQHWIDLKNLGDRTTETLDRERTLKLKLVCSLAGSNERLFSAWYPEASPCTCARYKEKVLLDHKKVTLRLKFAPKLVDNMECNPTSDSAPISSITMDRSTNKFNAYQDSLRKATKITLLLLSADDHYGEDPVTARVKKKEELGQLTQTNLNDRLEYARAMIGMHECIVNNCGNSRKWKNLNTSLIMVVRTIDNKRSEGSFTRSIYPTQWKLHFEELSETLAAYKTSGCPEWFLIIADKYAQDVRKKIESTV